jgi:2-dehydro-3-deoxyphosphooctonate aldolase (KDO 8-P synthase)
MVEPFQIGSVRFGPGELLFLIAGPCVIEGEQPCYQLAEQLKHLTTEKKIPFIFKASFDKANRTSLKSYRGPGLEQGLAILQKIRDQLNIPILTDVHEIGQVDAVSAVVDCLQVPAFLIRQTDLLLAVGQSGCAVNLKKGQFLSPWDMQHAVEKVASAGCTRILLTERGTSFGYNNLVVDMRTFPIMRRWGYPVIYDVTHSLQLPGGQGTASGGQPEYIFPMARAGVAAGADGLFLEVHENPAAALSDGANSLPLVQMGDLLDQILAVRSALPRVAPGQ